MSKILKCEQCGFVQFKDQNSHDYQPCIKCGCRDSLEEAEDE